MPAENLMMRVRIHTGELVRQLERLRAAFRDVGAAHVDLAAAFQPGGLLQQPAAVQFNEPCQLERGMIDTPEGPVTVVRDGLPALVPGVTPQDSFNRRPAWELGYRWVPLPPERVGYAGGEMGAIEAIRRVTSAEGTHPGVVAYAPVEGPTSSCSACPALVPPEELWVGKKSGIALCDPCMAKWERAGRAKRTGEF